MLNIIKNEKTAYVRYFREFLSREKGDALYEELYALKPKYFNRDLVNTPRGQVKALIYTAAFGEKGIRYRYAGYERVTIEEWPVLLKECNEMIEMTLDVQLNYAFCNIYETRDEDGNPVEHYIGWHADDEGEIAKTPDGQTTICSISLGDERKFQLRENYKVGKEQPTSIHSLILEHGSLCTMEKHTQQLMKHCVMKKKNASMSRINVTFRLMNFD